MLSELARQIREALVDPGLPPWFPGLTAQLTDARWNTLEHVMRLRHEDYGTLRAVKADPTSPREVERVLEVVTERSDQQRKRARVLVESLSDETLTSLFGCEAASCAIDEPAESPAIDRLAAAFSVLNYVPDAAESVATLVRTVHALVTKDDAYDVSFSDPRAPFSVFVSVPRQNEPETTLRVAESILHEAMHLQLTMIDLFVPLIQRPRRRYYSPWRKEERPVEGIVHAAYVFDAIYQFLALTLPQAKCESLERYILGRMRQIHSEFNEIRAFTNCPALTDIGASFVSRMFADVSQADA